ncbi:MULTISPECIES: hypothetical protein [unclassified Brevundimonas]|uniref:hypothetical protein n=1 Tax=unclassified Brevundimonas TaxID=2622653 RepID=UPI0025BCCD01|nr:MULTISPECIES: hypothetical protein [unclassified Brevundimonas]
MSQHNIIGSEAFDGRRYIIVRKVRGGISRRRRRSAILMVVVAVTALIIGALVAVFALAPLLMDRNHALANAQQAAAVEGTPPAALALPANGATTASPTGGPAVTPAR